MKVKDQYAKTHPLIRVEKDSFLKAKELKKRFKEKTEFLISNSDIFEKGIEFYKSEVKKIDGTNMIKKIKEVD